MLSEWMAGDVDHDYVMTIDWKMYIVSSTS